MELLRIVDSARQRKWRLSPPQLVPILPVICLRLASTDFSFRPLVIYVLWRMRACWLDCSFFLFKFVRVKDIHLYRRAHCHSARPENTEQKQLSLEDKHKTSTAKFTPQSIPQDSLIKKRTTKIPKRGSEHRTAGRGTKPKSPADRTDTGLSIKSPARHFRLKRYHVKW